MLRNWTLAITLSVSNWCSYCRWRGSNAFTSGWLADEERWDLWVIFPVWVSALILLVESWEHHLARKNTAIYPKDSIPAQVEQENRGGTGWHKFICKVATTGGFGGSGPPKIWTDHPNFFDEECDYRYVTDCSARNWVYHPYFVLYNNLDQGIGPPTLKAWLRPCSSVKVR